MTDDRRLEWADFNNSAREYAIKTVIRRTGLDRPEAEDLVFDAMVKLMLLRPLVRNPPALLTKTALHDFFSAQVREASAPALFAIAQDLGEDTEGAVHEIPEEHSTDPLPKLVEEEEEGLRRTGVRAAMDRLSEVDRQLLTAYYFEKRSLTDIDKERGEQPGTAKVRLHRARRRFRELVESGGERLGRSR